MKKIYTKPTQLLQLFMLPASVFFLNALMPQTSYGQTYYSTFSNVIGKFSVTEPSGGDCNAPSVQNVSSFADAEVNNFTFFKGTITSPLTCTNNNYVFKTNLKLPADTPYVPAGLQAAFRIKVPSHIDVSLLAKYVSLQTFLDNSLVENFSGKDIHFIDLATDSVRFIVYGVTTKNFNQLQLTVNGNIIPLNKNFEFDIQLAFASNTDLLPVTLNNFRVMPTGNNVTVSWQSLNEINISNYRIEKSSNNGESYTPIATLPAKGGSDAINYSYTDKAVANGNYLYRMVVVDKEGVSKATSAILASIAGKTNLSLMPSVVKAGQKITINSGITGSYQLAVFDLQGRMIKQQQVNSGDQATINTSGLSAGTYVVKIMTTTGNISQAKFIVN